jgi:acetate CoA/acetoacetate CoA-transferase beta subunit
VITEMAVIRPEEDGLVLLERAPGVAIEDITAATGARLSIRGEVPEMQLA